jgi:hypothetical protein
MREKGRALFETRTRPASRGETQFEKAHAPARLFDHHLASEHRRLPPRPTRKARMFVGTVSRPMQSAPPVLQPNEVFGGAPVPAIHAISTFPLVWVVTRPIRGAALLALLVLGHRMAKRHRNPDRTALRRGCIDLLFAMEITYLVWHPSRQRQANANNNDGGIGTSPSCPTLLKLASL